MGKLLAVADRLAMGAQPIVTPTALPAPITGWNTRDALDAMDPTDAVILDNWYPDAGGLVVRNGFQQWATGIGTGQVQTLAEYNAGATRKLLAAGGGSIYDASLTGAVGAALGSGFGSNQWQTGNFKARLFFVNGQDTPQVYNGSALANATFSGVTQSTLNSVYVYKQRLFFGAVNTQGFWYAALNAITGALTFFDLSTLSTLGGNMIAITSMSHDGGDGVQDYICFVMSSGDVFIYLGVDPGDATQWALVGRYRISPPVSPRAVCRYGAESYLTTADDHVPLQQQLVALKVGQVPPRSKVSSAVQNAVNANGAGFGWQSLYYPAGRRLIFNIPNIDGTFDQHVFNTETSAWCRFVGMPSVCWGLYNNNLFFGSAGGIVYMANTGSLDLLQPVLADAQQAWNKFDAPIRKRVTAFRPIVQSVGQIAYSFGVGFDYGNIDITASVASGVTGSPWNTSPWNTSPWSAEAVVDQRWRIAGGTGEAVSFRLIATATQPATWFRTDLRIEPGNAL